MKKNKNNQTQKNKPDSQPETAYSDRYHSNRDQSSQNNTEVEISICFPAFNEERNIGFTVADALRVMNPLHRTYEILVVNDGSQDGTASIVENLVGQHHQVRLHQHLQNQGYAATTRTCLEQARGKLIFVIELGLPKNLL